MGERNDGNEGSFGCNKSGGGLRGPRQGLGRTAEQVSEWLQDFGNRGDELPVKIDHPQEPLQALEVGRQQKILDDGDLAGERDNARGGHLMAKELEGGLGKDTLGRIDGETILLHNDEELAEVVQVLL